MQYCPKCKTEYEDHADMCVDCNIPLVPDLENHAFMKPLVKVKKGDSDQMLKYLEYSGIKKYEKELEGDTYLLKVPEEDYENAVMYLNVYIRENMEEDDVEDFYLDEYTTEEVDSEAKVNDMKSTVWTFGVVGGGVLLLAILNWFDIVSLSGFNKPMITTVFGILGIAFLIIAYRTNSGISAAAVSETSKEALIDAVVDKYKEKYNLENFYKSHKIKTDGLDEGALYFLVFDVLKAEVKKMNPEVQDTVVNTAVERLYDEISQ